LPDQPGVYRVPVTIAASRALPHNLLTGAWYSGDMFIRIRGLPGQDAQAVAFRFRSPSWVQRHILPPLQAVYGWWWPGVLTIPLSVIVPLLALLLFLGARNTRIASEMLAEEASARGPGSEGGGAELLPPPPPPPAPVTSGPRPGKIPPGVRGPGVEGRGPRPRAPLPRPAAPRGPGSGVRGPGAAPPAAGRSSRQRPPGLSRPQRKP
jgi:hypothetical protein